MLLGLNSLDGLLGVSSRDGGDNDSFKTGVPQHLVIVAVDSDALEVDTGPVSLLLDGSEGSNELGARSAVVEVEGMTSTHAAETGNGNLKLLGHGELVKREG